MAEQSVSGENKLDDLSKRIENALNKEIPLPKVKSSEEEFTIPKVKPNEEIGLKTAEILRLEKDYNGNTYNYKGIDKDDVTSFKYANKSNLAGWEEPGGASSSLSKIELRNDINEKPRIIYEVKSVILKNENEVFFTEHQTNYFPNKKEAIQDFGGEDRYNKNLGKDVKPFSEPDFLKMYAKDKQIEEPFKTNIVNQSFDNEIINNKKNNDIKELRNTQTESNVESNEQISRKNGSKAPVISGEDLSAIEPLSGGFLDGWQRVMRVSLDADNPGKIKIEQNSMEERKEFKKDDLKILEQLGINESTFEKNPGLRETLLKGEYSPVLNLKNDTVNFEGKVRILLKKDGKIDLAIAPKMQKLIIPQTYLKHEFSKDEIKQLTTKGELDKPIAAIVGRQQRELIVSVDQEVNQLRSKPLDQFKIPIKIGDQELTPAQRDTLKQGKPLEMEMTDRKGEKYLGTIKLSAVTNDGIRVIRKANEGFRNQVELNNNQSKTEAVKTTEKVTDRPVNSQQEQIRQEPKVAETQEQKVSQRKGPRR